MLRSTSIKPGHCAACDKSIDGTFLAFRCRLHCVCFPCLRTMPRTVPDWTKTQCAYCLMEGAAYIEETEFKSPFVKSMSKSIQQTNCIELNNTVPMCAWSTIYDDTIAIGRSRAPLVDIVHANDGRVKSFDLAIGEGITSGLYLDAEKCLLTVKQPLTYNVFLYNINPRCCSSSKPDMISEISFDNIHSPVHIEPLNLFAMSSLRYGIHCTFNKAGNKRSSFDAYAIAILTKKCLYTEARPQPSQIVNIQLPPSYNIRNSEFDRICGTPDDLICLSCYWHHEVLIFTDTGIYIKTIGYASDPMGTNIIPGGLWCPVSVETTIGGAVVVTCSNGDVHSFIDGQEWDIVRRGKDIGTMGSVLSDTKIWIARLDGLVDVFDMTPANSSQPNSYNYIKDDNVIMCNGLSDDSNGDNQDDNKSDDESLMQS